MSKKLAFLVLFFYTISLSHAGILHDKILDFGETGSTPISEKIIRLYNDTDKKMYYILSEFVSDNDSIYPSGINAISTNLNYNNIEVSPKSNVLFSVEFFNSRFTESKYISGKLILYYSFEGDSIFYNDTLIIKNNFKGNTYKLYYFKSDYIYPQNTKYIQDTLKGGWYFSLDSNKTYFVDKISAVDMNGDSLKYSILTSVYMPGSHKDEYDTVARVIREGYRFDINIPIKNDFVGEKKVYSEVVLRDSVTGEIIIYKDTIYYANYLINPLGNTTMNSYIYRTKSDALWATLGSLSFSKQDSLIIQNIRYVPMSDNNMLNIKRYFYKLPIDLNRLVDSLPNASVWPFAVNITTTDWKKPIIGCIVADFTYAGGKKSSYFVPIKITREPYGSVESADSENGLIIFPNPSSEFINLSLSEPSEYQIIDMNGAKLKSGFVSVSEKIRIADLANGVYLINYFVMGTPKFSTFVVAK